MSEIRCPKCGVAFTVDESEWAQIAQQVRTAEFEAELHARLDDAERVKKAEIAAALALAAQEAQQSFADKNAEIARLKSEAKAAKEAATAAKESTRTEQELAIAKAVAAAEKKAADAEASLKVQAAEQQVSEAALKEGHSKEVALLQEQVAQYRDFKAKQSVKLLGETLEQHCEVEFSRVRSMAFPFAKFGKDNLVAEGGKGDYIFRYYSADGVEFISIMFDMKNEAEGSSTKKKNSDFFAKLDKDRNAKGCEYAVLVSVLEEDSELYTGITDVSTPEYPKMFVVRPQFFVVLIALLRNAARDTIKVRAELERTKQQNIDITNFEAKLLDFQGKFSKNVADAGKQYRTAVDDIDDAIKKLEAIKEALRLWVVHLDRASDKANGLTLRSLTRGNVTMKRKFAEVEGPAEVDRADESGED